jgi:hypothetical protein
MKDDNKDGAIQLKNATAQLMINRLKEEKKNIFSLVKKGKKAKKVSKQIKYLNSIKNILKDILEKA